MASVLSAQTSKVGERIGDYRLVRFIGAGGMGEVYEAQHTTLGTRQAIKFLRRDHACRPDLVARFEQEARIASTLDSRHIVKVRELCAAEGAAPYMVMDLAEGRSLASILAEHGQLEVARALDLVRQACVGLCVAHDKRIVHRDLKPDNLYVCPQNDGAELLKILDFGIAKHLGASDSGPTTETGGNLGTAHYMSPEQAQGARHAIDHRTDIYSLGVILYEMLSGRRPHQGESYNEILIRIVTQRPVPLDAFCPDLPGELVRIVDRAMQREPSERFRSASEFGAALARLPSRDVESPCLGPRLGPAAHPRGPDMGTLEVCGATADRAGILRAMESGHGRAGLTDVPASEQPPRSLAHVRRRFLLALASAATITASVLWLRDASRDGRAPHAGGQPVLAPPPAGAGAGEVTRPTDPSGPLAPVAVSSESGVSSDAPTDATRIESRKKFSRASPVPPSAWPQNAAPPKRTDANAPRKGPTIDEPLPPHPQAPGVSPVME
jgi:hypothetical protein